MPLLLLDRIGWPALKLLAAIGVILAAYGYGRYHGAAMERVVTRLAIAEATQQARETEHKLAQASAAIDQAHAARQAQIDTRHNTIKQKVKTYAKDTTLAHCALPDGWVQLHDEAASLPADTAPTSSIDAAAEAVADADALSVIADNYATCTQNAEQLSALQDWVRATLDIATIEGDAKH